jgi:flagellin-like protein
MERVLKDRKGISPVIATVIIVAVTIAVAIAVAFWMGGLTTIFTRFEKLEITSAYADPGFVITLNFKNTGSADATISDVMVNGKPFYSYTSPAITAAIDNVPFSKGDAVSVKIGSEGTLVVNIPASTPPAPPFVSGVTVEVTIHTSAGKDYPRVVVLP